MNEKQEKQEKQLEIILCVLILLNLLYQKKEIKLDKSQNEYYNYITWNEIENEEYEQYYSLKIKQDKKDEFKNRLLNFLNKFLDELEEIIISKENPNEHRSFQIPYNKITGLIYNCELQIDDDKDMVAYEFHIYNENEGKYVQNKDLMNRVENHVQSCMLQLSKIQKASKEAQNIAENALKMTREADKKVKELNDIKHQIYTDFITILGIFTAITFAIFGGLQLIGNVFGNVKKFNLYAIGLDMILGSTLMFGIYIILMALIIGISKLKDSDTEYHFNKEITSWILKAFLFIFWVGVTLSIIYSMQTFIRKKWLCLYIVVLSLIAFFLMRKSFKFINKIEYKNSH